jgi:type II secretory pathway component PulC
VKRPRDLPPEPSDEASPSVKVADKDGQGPRSHIRLYGTAKVSAVYQGHEFVGVRLENIKAGSFWELIGVQDGDVVLEVHGQRMDDPAVGVALINSVSSDSEAKLRVRGIDGSQRYIEYFAPE